MEGEDQQVTDVWGKNCCLLCAKYEMYETHSDKMQNFLTTLNVVTILIINNL